MARLIATIKANPDHQRPPDSKARKREPGLLLVNHQSSKTKQQQRPWPLD